MTIHINFSNSIEKGLLLTSIQIRGTTETRRCVADAVRLQVITLNAPLTLRASYLPRPPHPPPSSSTCSHTRPLSPSLLTQHMVYRGVSTQLPLIKIIGNVNFAINLFCSPFFSAASYPYIFRNSPYQKNAPPFSANHQSENPFLPLSSLLQFLLLFNEYANYLYRRN